MACQIIMYLPPVEGSSPDQQAACLSWAVYILAAFSCRYHVYVLHRAQISVCRGALSDSRDRPWEDTYCVVDAAWCRSPTPPNIGGFSRSTPTPEFVGLTSLSLSGKMKVYVL